MRAEHPNLVGFKEFGGPEDLRYAAETSPAVTTTWR
ncbi:dihydrodipicolinate synthetase [Mesorhizobium amorphae CCNWGS0123]|uniref:Dihydrodipicolinate synthetase n=1 Tax=Mesorhizobium amorphae CCNWGS0123 TaxID=1082933 RepID=G6YLA3_9HYPH|nr:dihydrodipicolinate synthetase [Mesorhizobium amorphae CCNWGS0123]